MEGGKNQVTCFSRSQCGSHRFQVSHLSHQYNIWVLAEYMLQGTGKRPSICTKLSLREYTLLILMHKLYRVFDGDDLAFLFLVQIVYYRSKGSRFATSGWPCDHN